MLLNILKVLYYNKVLFIPYLVGDFSKSKSGLFFPCVVDKKIAAFYSISEARESLSSIEYIIDNEIEIFISIDDVMAWLSNNGSISLDALMDLNYFVFNYIIFFYSSCPKSLQESDSKDFSRLMSIHMENRTCSNIKDVDKYLSGMLFNEAIEREFHNSEVRSLLNSFNVKKRAQLLLDLFHESLSV